MAERKRQAPLPRTRRGTRPSRVRLSPYVLERIADRVHADADRFGVYASYVVAVILADHYGISIERY